MTVLHMNVFSLSHTHTHTQHNTTQHNTTQHNTHTHIHTYEYVCVYESNFKVTLNFNEQQSERKNKNRKIIWFNPPCNESVDKHW